MILPFVETMITQVCDLSCRGCTNYSDVKHSGYVTWDQGREQLLPWIQRIDIPDFGIIGGEPLINPEVRSWLRGIRSLMPHSQIRFTTNGLLLNRHFDIVDLMADIGNCVLKITVHVDDTELEQTIERIMNRFAWSPIVEHGIHRYINGSGFRFQINRPSYFVKTFQGDYQNMRPYDSNPGLAFENCCQQTCPLLYQSRLYKCSTSGLLTDILRKFSYPNIDLWRPYLGSGISSDCSDQELGEFINNFGKAENQCKMCPSKFDQAKIPHLANVSRRKPIYLTDTKNHVTV